MKNIIATALFIAFGFIAAGHAPAQNHLVQATVPFSFTVSDRILPSGTYMIRSTTSDSHLLKIYNQDGKIAILSLTLSGEKMPRKDNTLVFHKYGDQYFLSDIHSQGAAMNLHFPTAKTEKRAKAKVEEAGVQANDPVLIALR